MCYRGREVPSYKVVFVFLKRGEILIDHFLWDSLSEKYKTPMDMERVSQKSNHNKKEGKICIEN